MTVSYKMDAPVKRHLLDDMAQGVIGKPLDRPDGPLKVSGRATYAHEWAVPDMVHGVLVRAPFACGTVTGLGTGAAMALPGVLGVYDDDRMLRNPAQGTANEAPVQGTHEVFYFGQPIAVVVAESFEQARYAAQSLDIRFDARKPVVDPEDDATDVESSENDRTEEGDLDQAMREAHATVDEVYRTPSHASAAMEPHCSIAEWDGDRLTLRGSYQMLKYNRNEIADALGIEPKNVRILSPYVGGGFGSKLGIAAEAVAAAIASKALGRPVCVTMSRQQVFETVMRRSESRQRIRLAADKDGRLSGIGHAFRVSNLPGEVFAEPVTQATPFSYAGAHRLLAKEVVRLNRTCAGSVRAPGEAIGVPTLENAMDELAEKLGIDPVELRKRNIPETEPGTGKQYSSRKFAEALDEGARAFGWDRRNPEPGSVREGEWLIGMGMASAVRVNMLMESEARVTLDPAGTAIVETDMTDLGTGTYAVLTQVAGEMLGLPPEKIEVRLGDTDFPPGAGSGGSWGASSAGSSVFVACQELRRRIAEGVGCEPDDLVLKDGEAIAGNTKTSLAEVLDGNALSAEGRIEPGDTDDDVRQATFGAHFAEVAVSTITGETRVRRMLGVFGAGRILNEKTARSQCLGGLTWGIGMALTEELVHDTRDGHIVNRDFAEYHMPVNLDVPQIDIHFIEERDDWANPMQSKGLGELGICGAAAAVTNAIYNATGVRIRDYPATLDKVLAGLG